MGNRSDDFNRTDSSTSMGTPSDGGSAWVPASGTWGVIGNTGYKVATGATFEATTLEASSSSVDVEVTYTDLDNAGPVARLSNNSNFLMVQARDTENDMYAYKRVSGTFTQLGSTYSGAITNSDTIKLTVNASNSINVYLNTILRIGPVTDSAGSTNTKHGLMHYGTGDRANSFSITDTAAAGTYTLSNPTMHLLTATTGYPRVDVTVT